MTGAMAYAGTPYGISVSASPLQVDGYGSSGVTANVTTGAILASAKGGRAPYSYAWTRTDSTAYTWTADTPTAASTTFTAQSLPPGAYDTATFRVTVTDASGKTASKLVGATARNGVSDPGGGGGFCVAEETPILMEDGTEIPAGRIRVGDYVWTRHETTNRWGAYRVTAVNRVFEPVKRCWLPFWRHTIRATRNHRFRPLAWLLGPYAPWIKAKWIGFNDGGAWVMKITVEDAHTYVSAGVLSHNVKPPVDPADL